MAADLVPPGSAASGHAHYRTLLPLFHEDRDAFSPWASFLPDGPDALERLRTMGLYNLRHAARDVGTDLTGWDSARGAVPEDFVAELGAALSAFVPADAEWTLARWVGDRPELAHAAPVTIGGLDCRQQVLDLEGALSSLRALGMPEFMWCSGRSFAWGAPQYPDCSVITLSAEHYIRHFAPRGFECFHVLPDEVLPDSLGD